MANRQHITDIHVAALAFAPDFSSALPTVAHHMTWMLRGVRVDLHVRRQARVRLDVLWIDHHVRCAAAPAHVCTRCVSFAQLLRKRFLRNETKGRTNEIGETVIGV